MHNHANFSQAQGVKIKKGKKSLKKTGAFICVHEYCMNRMMRIISEKVCFQRLLRTNKLIRILLRKIKPTLVPWIVLFNFHRLICTRFIECIETDWDWQTTRRRVQFEIHQSKDRHFFSSIFDWKQHFPSKLNQRVLKTFGKKCCLTEKKEYNYWNAIISIGSISCVFGENKSETKVNAE